MLLLFSDGGGQRGSSAAGACILRAEGGEQINLVIYLGSGTNNEAEITAGLLGFAAMKCFKSSESAFNDHKDVHWVSDSEYTLKSATGYINNWKRNGWLTSQKKPVKNMGLWKSYLELAKGISVEPEHVKGHSGHPENELCDQASTWAQQEAESWLGSSSEVVVTDSGLEGGTWILIDGRKFIDLARSEDVEEAVSSLEKSLAGIVTGASAMVSGECQKQSPKGAAIREFENAVSKIRKRYGSEDPVLELCDDLNALLEKNKESV